MSAGRCSFAGRAALGSVAMMLLVACRESPEASVPVKRTELPGAPSARFVKLEELSEWSGKAWASMAEFNLVDSTGATIDRKSWTVTADSAGANEAPTGAIDGNPKTLWHSQWESASAGAAVPPPPHWYVVELGASYRISGFRYLPRQDGITNGVFAKYRFYVSNDGVNWGEPVSVGDLSGMGAVSDEKVVVFAKQTENHPPVATAPSAQNTPMGKAVSVQLIASDVDGDHLSYAASGLPSGLGIAPATGLITGTPIVPGAYPVNVSVSDGKGPSVSVAFQWTVLAPTIGSNAAKPAPGEVRFVKLEAVSEVNGKPWTSMAEFNLIGADKANLPRDGWTASADSADTSDTPASAIDGNPASIWHTQWDGASPPPPHSFIVDIGHAAMVRGFRYLPRQDTLANGIIARFRFYTSFDGVEWGKPVAEGDFSAMGSLHAEKTVALE